jgi:hypothetical protein
LVVVQRTYQQSELALGSAWSLLRPGNLYSTAAALLLLLPGLLLLLLLLLLPTQVLYSIPGADITNNPSLLATFVLNLIFIFGLLVRIV